MAECLAIQCWGHGLVRPPLHASQQKHVVQQGVTCSAQSRSSLLWLAEMQMRARADRRGVAGKPTTTMAMPRSSSNREVDEILPGLNSITGCMDTMQLSQNA